MNYATQPAGFWATVRHERENALLSAKALILSQGKRAAKQSATSHATR